MVTFVVGFDIPAGVGGAKKIKGEHFFYSMEFIWTRIRDRIKGPES